MVTAPASPTRSAEPHIRFPIAEAPPSKPLPTLAESDSTLQDALVGLYGRGALTRFFHIDDIIRRFVATIDNLPRQTAALRLMPVKPVAGALATSKAAGNTQISDENYLRYRPFLQLMEAVEAKRLVAVYVHFYPLFQTAYRDLGYPTGYFSRLISVARWRQRSDEGCQKRGRPAAA